MSYGTAAPRRIIPMETAVLFNDVFKLQDDMVMKSETLLPDSPLEEIITEINSTGKERIGIVGHNPHLSELCCALLGSDCRGINLKKSAVVRIDFPSLVRKEEGTLRWLVTPEVID